MIVYSNSRCIGFLITLCLMFPSPGFAIPPVDEQRAIEQQNRILQQQDKAFDQWQQQHQHEQQSPDIEIDIPQQPSATGANKNRCFEVQTITLEGAAKVDAQTQQQLVAPYINTCISVQSIQSLVKEVTAYYVGKGYITTRVYVPKQDLHQGSLKLQVIEGKLEAIQLNKNSTQDQWQVATAFPQMKRGELLNLRDLEQGLDQMGRLSSNNATMDLLPGKEKGSSIVSLSNTPQHQTRFVLGADNAGQKSTGEYRLKGTLYRDNLIGVNDFWSLNYAENPDSTSGKLSRSAGLYVSVPYGYWTFSSNATYSEYESTINGSVTDFITSGNTDNYSVDLSRLIYRSQTQKLSLAGRLDLKESENFIEDVKIDNSSRSLSVASLTLDHSYHYNGHTLSSAMAYHQGLDAFGAKEDGSGLTSVNPRAQFQKFTADVNYCHPVPLSGSFALNYCGNAQGQYSFDPLYSQEQLAIGDQYSVRGFKENGISGDSGAYLRNELSFVLPPLSDKEWYQSVIGSIQPFVAYDNGMIRDMGGKEANGGRGKGYLSGWATGINIQSPYLNIGLTYSQPITSPSFVTERDDEIYASASVTIRL
ncbi:MAG: ShlB/FhaC/HecB family hemolysin secretion/activation protein [Alphaproteobacteria bacterium]|nr:ShlB/FhaC/HecB family hemolysin secretion/activation protein [Alphaproteobacteria bacterium]